MKLFMQLLRQPMKYVAGIIVVSLAVSILSVCVGQAIVAEETEAQMERHFTTVALPTTKYNYEEMILETFDGQKISITAHTYFMPDEIVQWIADITETRTDLIDTVSAPGLASAFIPELTPDNVTDHLYYPDNVGTSETMMPHSMAGDETYACAMLEIVLEEVGEPELLFQKGKMEDGTEISVPYSATVEIKGTITQVLSLQSGYEDPTGLTACLTIVMPDEESLKALNLTVGERYIVYGDDYLDGNWAFCGRLTERLKWQLDDPVVITEIDENAISYYTQQEQELHMKLNPNSELPIARYRYQDASVILFEDNLKEYNSILMTLKDETLFGSLQHVDYSDGSGTYPVMNWDRYITDENGNQVQITQEEYSELYSVPTIAHLEGTVEEFLQSEEGKPWAEKLEQMQVNYQAFAVIGVEKMGYIADFARGTARIVEGRDFTAEELESGAKVCIISESLAAANGLSVGDTISPRFYNYDFNDPHQELVSEDRGVINPYAYSFTANTEWAGEAEEYVIVGLYRQDNAWGNVSENLYSFTPNTIFAPKASISSDMDYGTQGFFRTLVLHNGAIAEFRAVVEEAGYSDLFVFYDQEYTTISASLQNYREVAQRAMLVGVAVYGVILLLFLLFYPGSQGKVLATMTALGAQRKNRIAHIFMSGAGILLPGTLIGSAIGVLLWQEMVDMIAGAVDTAVTLEMDMGVFLLIALCQLLLAMVLTAMLALPMTRTRGLSKRR